MMTFLIRVEGEDELRSLCEWLVDEPAVRTAELSGAAAAPGEQGTIFDVIQAILTDGMSMAALVVTIKQWQATRPTAPKVKLQASDGSVQVVVPSEEGDAASN